jgi:hypothetical protein
MVGLPVPEPKWVQNLSKSKLQTCGIPTAIAIENEVICLQTMRVGTQSGYMEIAQKVSELNYK